MSEPGGKREQLARHRPRRGSQTRSSQPSYLPLLPAARSGHRFPRALQRQLSPLSPAPSTCPRWHHGLHFTSLALSCCFPQAAVNETLSSEDSSAGTEPGASPPLPWQQDLLGKPTGRVRAWPLSAGGGGGRRRQSPTSSLLLWAIQTQTQEKKWEHCCQRDTPRQSWAWPSPWLLGFSPWQRPMLHTRH